VFLRQAADNHARRIPERVRLAEDTAVVFAIRSPAPRAAGRLRPLAAVTAALRNTVSAIGVVRFPELPPKGDLSDYFARGGSRDYLLTRIEAALKTGTAAPYIVTNLATRTPRAAGCGRDISPAASSN
jgi:hypothetical protein